jgi:hypothetical protein
VGYGWTSPKTWEGQLVCMCYSLIGIPMFLTTLTNLSVNFGNIFSYLYTQFNNINPITKYCRELKKRRKIKKRNLKKQANSESTTLKSSINLDTSINQSELDHALFVLGDLNPQLEFSDDDDDSDMEDGDNDESKKSEVPILLALFILFGYLYGGVCIFHKLENWDFSQSFYFVIITLLSVVSIINIFIFTKLICGLIYF